MQCSKHDLKLCLARRTDGTVAGRCSSGCLVYPIADEYEAGSKNLEYYTERVRYFLSALGLQKDAVSDERIAEGFAKDEVPQDLAEEAMKCK